MRKTKIVRKTKETNIELELNLDGKGSYKIKTGIGFFDHMLELVAKHSLIDLKVKAVGDSEHHIVEDVGIVFGQALNKSLGDKRGISRYGFLLPMDEALAQVAIDLGGRPYLVFDAEFDKKSVEGFSTELVQDFFQALCTECKCNLHIKLLYGRNTHHKIEAIFKCFARALRMASAIDARTKNSLPSTKGKL